MATSKTKGPQATLSAGELQKVRGAFKSAGQKAVPAGNGGKSAPFKVGGKEFSSMLDLARKDPAAFVTLDRATLKKANPKMSDAGIGARMAHRSRILRAANAN